MLAPLAHGDATLEQQSPNLVDHRGAPYHPPFADPVQRLQVELIIAFDRHKAHRGTGYSFGDGFGIDGVVLVRLHVRLHILGWHQGERHAPVPAASGRENEILRKPPSRSGTSEGSM
jgi:hypothetical protein